MVKTRSQSKQQLTKQKEKTGILVQKHKEIKKPRVTRNMLRQSVIDKIARQSGGKNFTQGKIIDFNSDQYSSIAHPEKFNCPICLQLMIFPVITNCGHAYCLPCLQESLKHKNSCSLCRKQISYDSFGESHLVQNIITKISQNSLKDYQKNQYQTRIKKFREIDEKRQIPQNISEGDLVDFFADRIWSQGKIVAIQRDGIETFFMVESTKQKITHRFSLGSRKLAKHRQFTREDTRFRDLMNQYRQDMNFQGILQFDDIFQEINPANLSQGLAQDGDSEFYRFY